MDGIYFGSASLKDSYVAFIFFTDINDGTSLRIIVGNATKNGKSYKYPSKLEYYLNETEINFNTDISMNDFLKIDEKKLIFISTEGNSQDINRKLHILLFHFFDDYSKMKLRIFSYDVSDYVFIKDLQGYFYNGYLVFDATSVMKTDEDLINYFSLFMIFGYENGTNYTKDISFLFSDSDNYNPNKNFVSFLHDNIIIDNNIFGYIQDNELILISIPQEISILKENEANPLGNNSILNINENYILKQNKDLIKNYQYYYIEYQYIIREPDFENLFGNEGEVITLTEDDDYNFKSEYEQRKFTGRISRLNFKLCHDYWKM